MNETVALITDFGLKDHYVGVIKARILKELKNSKFINFIDITHDIPPYHIKKGAIVLYFSYKYFPKGTIFLVIIDPGVGTQRKALVIITQDYIFIGPDNGVFTLIYKENPKFLAFEIIKEKVLKPPYSETFHGRDLFAPAVAYILNDRPLEEFLIPVSKDDLIKLEFTFPEETPMGLKLSIWDVDHFGNLITNFHKSMIKHKFKIFVNKKEIPLIKSYGYAEKGKIIALFGSEGLLEIAIREGSAFEILQNPEIEIIWEK